jgi:hypothetical protein
MDVLGEHMDHHSTQTEEEGSMHSSMTVKL